MSKDCPCDSAPGLLSFPSHATFDPCCVRSSSFCLIILLSFCSTFFSCVCMPEVFPFRRYRGILVTNERFVIRILVRGFYGSPMFRRDFAICCWGLEAFLSGICRRVRMWKCKGALALWFGISVQDALPFRFCQAQFHDLVRRYQRSIITNKRTAFQGRYTG